MSIKDNDVVQFHYTLKDETGQELETSRGHEPVTYLHGHGSMIPGLEKAIHGRKSGESFNITVPPEDAYGPRQENAIQRISIKHLHGAKNWKPGMLAVVETDHGPRQVMVVKVGHSMADVDVNHPLAGKTLSFDVEILEVRAATEEELAHGHVHGPGGHHH
ncbi:MAG TPA: peptidylprolyl isomerase [Gammaproteobacteria bacterium]